MQKDLSNSTLGILGGIGPLASSKFVQTIYFSMAEHHTTEQSLPKIVLYSDPSMPDRTQYLDLGLQDVLLNHLVDGLTKLLKLGADNLVICCFTLHHLLPLLPQSILKHVIALPDLALNEVLKLQSRSLVLCTSATNRLKIFESAKNWEDASVYVDFLDPYDQKKMHEIIYMLKKNMGYEEAIEQINYLLEKYQAKYWIAGCTEFHLISHYLLNKSARIREQNKLTLESKNCEKDDSHHHKLLSIIDPLLIVANLINANLMNTKRSGEEKCPKKISQIFSKTN